jgi:hypothetical protein
VQHLADRIFAERSVRYGRMAMIQPRLRHRSKAYLTIETPVVARPFRVIGDWVEPAASPAMSAMPPKAEVIS